MTASLGDAVGASVAAAALDGALDAVVPPHAAARIATIPSQAINALGVDLGAFIVFRFLLCQIRFDLHLS